DEIAYDAVLYAPMSSQLSQQEQEKLAIINKTISGNLSNEQAATMLGVSSRQIKRLKKKVRIEGVSGVVHKLKGKQSNHCIQVEIKTKTVRLLREQYADFKPTFASEKL